MANSAASICRTPASSAPNLYLELAGLSPRSASAASGGLISSARAAQKLLNEAAARRGEILAEAEALAQQIYRRAELDGFDEGRRSAIALLLDSAAMEKKIEEGLQSKVAEVAAAVAEEVLGASLKEQPEAILDRVTRALRLMPRAGLVKLHIHPEDILHITRALSDGRLSGEAGQQIELIENAALPAGSARLETNGGAIEADVAEHLRCIRRWLKQRARELFPLQTTSTAKGADNGF